jgi:1-deoxy-D-xylulose-5-phosphate synthase
MTKTADSILEHLPGIGKTVGEAIERIKKSIRMALPASQVFEAMDIPYFGPVDGHDIKTLTNLFDELKDLNHPALLHVYTEKGKGYKPAAEQPQNYHSTPPFSISKETSYDEGQPIPGKAEGDNRLSFTKAFSNAITKIAEKDDRIVAITSAMGEGTGLGEFRKKFPDRYYDVGIAESAAVDIAAGLAKQGKKPIVCIYSTFLQRAFDQIFQEVTLQGLSVIFCIDRAGLVGSDGPTHHGLMDIGYLRMLDGIDLISPADENEMHAALEYAVNSDNSTAIRYARDKIASQLYKPFADKLETPFEKGKSVKLIAPENPKAAIITYGQMLAEGIKACDILKKDGIQTELINARFANPIDDELAGTAVKMPLVTVEDHSIAAGFGSAVMEKLSQKGFAAKVAALGVPAKPIRHDTRANQLAECGLNAQSIAETVKKL